MKTYEKIDEQRLSVVEMKPAEVLPAKTYDYGFLKQQLINIQEQKDRDNALRDAEIAEVEKLIVEADKLGIIEKVEAVIEPVVEPLTKIIK